MKPELDTKNGPASIIHISVRMSPLSDIEEALLTSSSTSSCSNGQRPHVRKKPGPVGPPTTKVAVFILITSAFCIYYVYFMFSQVSRDPFPRPTMIDRHSPFNKLTLTLNLNLKREKMACHLPDLKPFASQVLEYVQPPDPVDCRLGHPLLFKSDLNRTLIQVTDPKRYNYTRCCFHSFSKISGLETKITYSKACVPIKKKNTVIEPPIEFIQVKCINGSEVQVPVDFFGFTPLKKAAKFKRSVKRKQKNPLFSKHKDGFEKVSGSTKIRKVNVVILGIDAVSHMNFQRVMPLTFAYLTRNLSAVGMSGYTKLGDNTLPNLVPALTGFALDELESVCWNKSLPFDDCPFIWKTFSEQGYLTAYGEDAVWMGIFQYTKKGFRQAPTNYYYNTFMNDMEKKVGHEKHTNAKWCYGPRLSFEILLDFLKKMAFNMNKVHRYFQFVWISALFHDYMNTGMLVDQLLLNMLIWFKKGGYLEDTALILMSDHGLRYGGIRNTLQGKLEERMPFLYFVFPPWFKERYQSAVSNMKRNSKKLTTHFDLHETLLDLAYLENITSERVRARHFDLVGREERPRGISLFLPVPSDRTCKHAAIPDAWCVCRSRKPVTVKNNELVKEAAEHAVEFINKLFVPFPQCARLTLKSVQTAEVFQAQNSKVEDISKSITRLKDKRLSKQSVTYTITFSTSPSDALFEATTTRDTNGSWTTSREISRTSLYGNQSWCVDDYDVRKFCFCL